MSSRLDYAYGEEVEKLVKSWFGAPVVHVPDGEDTEANAADLIHELMNGAQLSERVVSLRVVDAKCTDAELGALIRRIVERPEIFQVYTSAGVPKDQAITSGDAVAMLRALQELRGIQE